MNQLRSYGIEIDIGTEYKEAITVWAGDDPQDKTANITAELITDSLNTAQKCGLLPSELLRQRDELIERNQMLSKTLTKLNVMVDINTGNKNQ